MDYATLSGGEGEDIDRFHDHLLKVFTNHRLAKTHMWEKLRRFLSGKALVMVPEDTDSEDTAMKIL